MSEHRVTVTWARQTPDFSYQTYNRSHTWSFDGGAQVRASAAPAYRGDPACVDPEEAFVAALSACHMLTFLALATKKRLVVDRYVDEATGYLEKDDRGKLAVTRVVLRPRIEFGGAGAPPAETLAELHHDSHEHCFIASSVRTEVTVEAPTPVAP
jgi:organic hydroperoxide reductase OsmC/OhrA